MYMYSSPVQWPFSHEHHQSARQKEESAGQVEIDGTSSASLSQGLFKPTGLMMGELQSRRKVALPQSQVENMACNGCYSGCMSTATSTSASAVHTVTSVPTPSMSRIGHLTPEPLPGNRTAISSTCKYQLLYFPGCKRPCCAPVADAFTGSVNQGKQSRGGCTRTSTHEHVLIPVRDTTPHYGRMQRPVSLMLNGLPYSAWYRVVELLV